MDTDLALLVNGMKPWRLQCQTPMLHLHYLVDLLKRLLDRLQQGRPDTL